MADLTAATAQARGGRGQRERAQGLALRGRDERDRDHLCRRRPARRLPPGCRRDLEATQLLQGCAEAVGCRRRRRPSRGQTPEITTPRLRAPTMGERAGGWPARRRTPAL